MTYDDKMKHASVYTDIHFNVLISTEIIKIVSNEIAT